MKKLFSILFMLCLCLSAKAQSSCPDNNHPHTIDLGLPSGTLWACCNLSASKPEEYGGYYAWGETEEKDFYYLSSYTHCDGSDDTFHDIGDDIAGTIYDVAFTKGGSSWRMPSIDQLKELLDNCILTWTSQNGVKGINVTGPNDCKLFLPAAGIRDNSHHLLLEGEEGWYWSSTFNKCNKTCAFLFRFNSRNKKCSYIGRFCGLPVRPVVSP